MFLPSQRTVQCLEVLSDTGWVPLRCSAADSRLHPIPCSAKVELRPRAPLLHAWPFLFSLNGRLAAITPNYASPGLSKCIIRLEAIRNVYRDLKPKVSNTPTSPPEGFSLKKIFVCLSQSALPSQFQCVITVYQNHLQLLHVTSNCYKGVSAFLKRG